MPAQQANTFLMQCNAIQLQRNVMTQNTMWQRKMPTQNCHCNYKIQKPVALMQRYLYMAHAVPPLRFIELKLVVRSSEYLHTRKPLTSLLTILLGFYEIYCVSV